VQVPICLNSSHFPPITIVYGDRFSLGLPYFTLQSIQRTLGLHCRYLTGAYAGIASRFHCKLIVSKDSRLSIEWPVAALPARPARQG
jgi:hypothetical protein